jgi:hypothetical protein
MKGKKPRRTGLIVEPDDMDVGLFFAVHSTKDGSEYPLPIAGMAFRVTAINLPFLVGNLVCDPVHPPVTFDTRYFRFQKVTNDFILAQQPQKDQDAAT